MDLSRGPDPPIYKNECRANDLSFLLLHSMRVRATSDSTVQPMKCRLDAGYILVRTILAALNLRLAHFPYLSLYFFFLSDMFNIFIRLVIKRNMSSD